MPFERPNLRSQNKQTLQVIILSFWIDTLCAMMVKTFTSSLVKFYCANHVHPNPPTVIRYYQRALPFLCLPSTTSLVKKHREQKSKLISWKAQSHCELEMDIFLISLFVFLFCSLHPSDDCDDHKTTTTQQRDLFTKKESHMSEKLLRCLISTTCRRSTHIIQTTSMRGMLIFSQQELHFLVPLNTEQVVWQCSVVQ